MIPSKKKPKKCTSWKTELATKQNTTKHTRQTLWKLFFAVAENKEEFLVLLKQALETRVKEYQQKIFDTEEQIQHLQCLKEKREDEK